MRTTAYPAQIASFSLLLILSYCIGTFSGCSSSRKVVRKEPSVQPKEEQIASAYESKFNAFDGIESSEATLADYSSNAKRESINTELPKSQSQPTIPIDDRNIQPVVDTKSGDSKSGDSKSGDSKLEHENNSVPKDVMAMPPKIPGFKSSATSDHRSTPSDLKSDERLNDETNLSPPNAGRLELRTIQSIAEKAKLFYEEHDKYTALISRQVKINSKDLEAETMLMHYRVDPRSVYFEWFNGEHKDRQCIWTEKENKIKTQFKFIPISIDPDSIMAKNMTKKSSRYSIRSCGLDLIVAKLHRAVFDRMKGNPNAGSLTVVQGASESEVSSDHTAEAKTITIRQQIFANYEPEFPEAAVREWTFNESTGQLITLKTWTLDGKYQDRYSYRVFVPNPDIDDIDFDADYRLRSKEKEQTKADLNPELQKILDRIKMSSNGVDPTTDELFRLPK